MAYDILIKGGSVFDGSGAPSEVADIAVKGDEIAAVGALGNSSADLVIDASSKYVAPGFVDVTCHSDTHLTLFHYPEQESLLMQGITTIVGGNCGASLAPLGSPAAIEAVRKWADPSSINLNWATVKEYLDQVEKLRTGVNVGMLIGYGTLRRGVIGTEAKPFEIEETEELKLLLKRGLDEGALGLSIGLSYEHERISTTDEIIQIARVVGTLDRVVKIHLRSEGSTILASVNEAIRIAREARVAVVINHLKVIGKKAWSSLPKVIEVIERAAASGVDISFDVSPYRTTGSLLYLLVPVWARSGGLSELFKKMDSEEERKKIIEGLKEYTLHYDRILIVSAKTTSIVGHTLAEIAEHMNLSPEEALLEILRANEGRVRIVGRTVSLKNTETEIKHPLSFIASDGAGYNQDAAREGNLVHPRSFGAFPHFWHHFIREKKLLKPEEGIKKMTLVPAEKLGIRKRGSIKKGNFADIVIFNPDLFCDRATHRSPFRFPAGIEWVLINGKVAVEQGRYGGGRFGQVVRKK